MGLFLQHYFINDMSIILFLTFTQLLCRKLKPGNRNKGLSLFLWSCLKCIQMYYYGVKAACKVKTFVCFAYSHREFRSKVFILGLAPNMSTWLSQIYLN